jgi:hypothetical protein
MAFKYDAPMVQDVVARIHLPRLIKAYPRYGWVISCRFGRLEEAREAIRALLRPDQSRSLPGAKRWDDTSNKFVEGRRDYCL